MSGNTYTVNANGYEFEVDMDTGTTTARGEITAETAARSGYKQAKTGGELREDTDQGGHLVAASENGPAIDENLSAQNKDVNQKGFKHMEAAERELVKNGQASIQTERTAYVSSQRTENGQRPDAYMINDRITWADGRTENAHLSFQNMSYEEQQQLNDELAEMDTTEDYDNPGDSLRESMTDSEYAQLMEETDMELGGIKDEFMETESVDFLSADSNTDVSNEADGGMDCCTDCGADCGAEM